MQTSLLTLMLVLSSAITTWSDALDNWSTNQVSTNSFGLNQVVYGNGRFVAAGGQSDGGAILSSEDGATWTVRANGYCCSNPSLVWGLAYGSGRFVAVGHFGGVATSTNGIHWSFTNVPTAGYAVAYGAGRFVAVGGAGVSNIFTSTDGLTWTQRRSHATEERDIVSVTFGALPGGGLRFVAIGPNDGFIYVSSDGGATWTRSSIAGGGDVSYANGLFFVPLGNGTNLLSTNAVSWNATSTGLTGTLGKVTYAAGLYIARVLKAGGWAGASSSFATSVNGTNWLLRSGQTEPQLPGPGSNSGFAFDGHRFVTVGSRVGTGFFEESAFVFRSDDIVSLAISDAATPRIIVSGLEGRSYQLEYRDAFQIPGTNWLTLTNIVLTNSQLLFHDSPATGAGHRFYRAALLP